MDNVVDITGEAFARRLGSLLAHHRVRSGLSLGALARRSNGHFTRRQLRQFEAAGGGLDAVTVSALATLYGVDIESILAERTDIAIDSGGGTLSAGGVHATFDAGDPRSLLETYLRLVRRLRDQERAEVVDLRREDIEGLAEHLDESGESVVEQLGALMGATRTQRRAMAGMFIAGALVITVAVPSVAAVTGGESPTAFDVTPGSPSVDAVEVLDALAELDEFDPAHTVHDVEDAQDAHDVDQPAPRARPAENGVVLEDVEPVHHVAPEVAGAADTSPVDTSPAGSPPAETPELVEVQVAPPPVPTAPTVVVDPVPAAEPDVESGAEPGVEPGAEPGVESGAEPDVAVGPPPVPVAPDQIVEPGPGPVLPVADPVSP